MNVAESISNQDSKNYEYEDALRILHIAFTRKNWNEPGALNLSLSDLNLDAPPIISEEVKELLDSFNRANSRDDDNIFANEFLDKLGYSPEDHRRNSISYRNNVHKVFDALEALATKHQEVNHSDYSSVRTSLDRSLDSSPRISGAIKNKPQQLSALATLSFIDSSFKNSESLETSNSSSPNISPQKPINSGQLKQNKSERRCNTL